ncbi:MAG: tail fiber protein [Alphaproteobacteria bacterium]|nr:tail fiber protein [Alphaproteobacteria bacterium]
MRHNGNLVARVGAGGLSGLAPASVGSAALAAAVAEALNPVGLVSPFAGTAAPNGWLFCFGQAVSRTTFAALFTVLGTAYGAGDGTTTFNLPDLRGRTPFGLDNMGGTDAGRLNTANSLGVSGGAQLKTLTSDNVTLSVANLPSHSHATTIDTNLASGHGTNTGSLARGVQNGSFLSDYNLGGTTGSPSIFPTANTGSGTAFTVTDTNVDFMPPFLQLNYIIKV